MRLYMKIKKIILMASLFLILISIGHVSAIDNQDNATNSNTLEINEKDMITASIEENDEIPLGYGTYNGLNNEPAWTVNEYEIKINKIHSANNVEIFLNFSGITQVTEFTLDDFPAYIVENEKTIGKVPLSSVSNTDYPTKIGVPYSFNATFNYTLKNYDTELKVKLCSLDSNTLIFHKTPLNSLIELDDNSIIILNENGEIITPNSSWTNSIDSLENAIKLVENNGIIYLNDLTIYSNNKIKKEIEITKNITIIGENTKINGLDNDYLFNIKSNVTFKNIIFENTFDYIINVENECILDNCTFKDTNGKAINNNGKLKIINSKLGEIKKFQTLSKWNTLENNITALIYNQNELEIINTTFNNIIMPKKIKIMENKSATKISLSSAIYNSNNASISIINSSFFKIDAKLINNDGVIYLNNCNFTEINVQNPNLEIMPDKETTLQRAKVYSYKLNWDNEMTTGPIYSSNFISINNTSFRNISLKNTRFKSYTQGFAKFDYFVNNQDVTIYIKKNKNIQ